MTKKNTVSLAKERRINKGTWFEVCVSQDQEVRDVITENCLYDAKKRADTLATQWPDCDMVFIRHHSLDSKCGPGASTFSVLHKLTLDFRGNK